jgi:hypothetical protein
MRGESERRTFSSQGRQSAASSAAQKSTATALSQTSQIVLIPSSRARSSSPLHPDSHALPPPLRALQPPPPSDLPALCGDRSATATAAG